MAFGTYQRAGYAPRRGHGRGGRPAPLFKKRIEVQPDIHKHPLGELLVTLSNSDLEPKTASFAKPVAIQDCKYVGSYNWANSKSPIIMIPGKPPRWTPLKEPRRLDEDSGQYFRDPNAARFASYPTEPAVQALFKTDPDFPTNEIDIFGCGNTMGNLLRFVRSVDKRFRFSVEVIGSTVFFVRKENDPRELIEGVVGFGHTFPDAYTTWPSDVKGSESHQRLVQYELGGLNCIVRFECDGFLSDDVDASKLSSIPKLETESDLDALFKSFGDTTMGATTPYTNEPITIKTSGDVVPQEAIFDLKTRSCRSKTKFDLEDIYPVLWLKQIPKFIIAYHDGAGLFRDIRVQDVKEGIQDWEKRNHVAIQRLGILLKKIVAMSQNTGTKLMEVYSPSVDHLEIRKQIGAGSHALPSHLIAKWEETDDRPDSFEDAEDRWDSDQKEDFGYGSASFADSDDEDLDFTACSAHDCGYCGRCTY